MSNFMSMEMRFSNELYRCRLDRGFTQREVAEQLNISLRWFQYIEKGQRMPSSKLMLEIFVLFEINGSRLKNPEEIDVSLSGSGSIEKLEKIKQEGRGIRSYFGKKQLLRQRALRSSA